MPLSTRIRGIAAVLLMSAGCGSSSQPGSGSDAGQFDGPADVADGASATDAVSTQSGDGNADVAGDVLSPDATANVDANSFDATLDLSGVAPPTELTATVFDRRRTLFKLIWTAPSDNGGRVAGYQIRYAKVPITAANFDDASVTTPVPYVGSPAAPGAADGTLVRGLIETEYYFAVVGTGAGGNHVGPLSSTSTPLAAHFNVTLLNSPSGTAQQFGAVIDGSADLNGDGISDVVVGTFGDTHAYIFLGGTVFAPTVPAVTITGANIGFGVRVAAIGDVNHDGLEDIAISDFPTGQKIFIFKGRVSWPMALTDAQADYVISGNSSYAASNFGGALARLGDFNGDGVDDFAFGAPLFNDREGRVVVVYGRADFSSFAVPDVTRTLEIAAEPTLSRSQIGLAVTGLGHFFATLGTTLVVSATGLGAASNASSNQGKLYAFHGRGPGTPIDASMADNAYAGPGKGAEIGHSLSNLGPIVGAQSALGVGNTVDTLSVPNASGTAFVFTGSSSLGPFANPKILYGTGATSFGQVLFGGGFSGRDGGVSLVGDSTPDVAISGSGTGTLDIIDGSQLPSRTSPVDLKAGGDVHVPMPTGWVGTATGPNNLIRDINGDGDPDFALGDLFGTVPGRVAVFW